MKYALICAVFATVLCSGNTFAANNETETLKNQLELMQERIARLEKESEKKSDTTPSGENTGNPSISVIGNFTGHRSRGEDGFGSSSFLPLSETEIIFGANIDPHARLDLTVTGADGGMAVEEGFITAYLPNSFNLKAGRKFLPVGKANEVHPHALVYADRPNGLVNLFGPEIFVGDGLLIDRPFFTGNAFQSVSLGVFSTENDIAFDSTATSQYAGLIRGVSVWDTSDFSTLELGATYVQGKNGLASDSFTRIASGHAAWKLQNLDHSGLNIEAEWMRRSQEQDLNTPTSTLDGSYLLADFRINRSFHVFVRADYSKEHARANQTARTEKAFSLGSAWKISEFQSLTIQYKQTHDALDEVAGDIGIAAGNNANTWFFRWVVAIGPHGAHPY